MSESEVKSNVPDGLNEHAEQQPDAESLIISTRADAATAVRELGVEARSEILELILCRLKKPTHFKRPNVDINEVQRVLLENPAILDSIFCMEHSGGGPDIISLARHNFVFADCSPESPAKRRGLDFCSVTGEAEKFGISLMPKKLYAAIQRIGEFDFNSSSVLASDELIQGGLSLVGFRGSKGASFINVGIEKKSPDRGWRGVIEVPRKKK